MVRSTKLRTTTTHEGFDMAAYRTAGTGASTAGRVDTVVMRARTFLTLAGLGALNTVNGYRPIFRRGPGTLASSTYGLIASELPLQTIAGQATLTAALARRGALRGPAGKLGAVVTAASWAGLVGLHLEARRAGDHLERALVEGLGPDYRSHIVEPRRPVPGEPKPRFQRALRSLRGRRRYRTVKNVPYGGFGRRNHMDIWRRADVSSGGRAPVLVQIHGGAWVMGSKDAQALPLMTHLAERGWVCVAINYRLSPRSSWPDHIVDVKRAIAWVRDNIEDYGGDPDFVVVTGGSAGGHLAALAALTPNDPEYQPGFEDADTRVQGAVPFYGVYDWINRDGSGSEDLRRLLERRVFKAKLEEDPQTWDKASPISRVGPDAPPMFLLHGTADVLVPVEQARSFARMLRAVSKSPVAFAELPRAQHGFEAFDSVRSDHSIAAVERFLGFLYGDHLERVSALRTVP
jgi:acetyl esterase/lipase